MLQLQMQFLPRTLATITRTPLTLPAMTHLRVLCFLHLIAQGLLLNSANLVLYYINTLTLI